MAARGTKVASAPKYISGIKGAARILDVLDDAVYVVDPDGKFAYANRAALQMWGRERDSIVGKHLLEAFPQAASSDSWSAHQKALKTRERVEFETRSPVLGRWLCVRIHPAELGGLVVHFRDITEAKAARDSLAAGERRLRELTDTLDLRVKERTTELAHIFELSLDILGVCGFDGRFRSASPAWETIT